MTSPTDPDQHDSDRDPDQPAPPEPEPGSPGEPPTPPPPEPGTPPPEPDQAYQAASTSPREGFPPPPPADSRFAPPPGPTGAPSGPPPATGPGGATLADWPLRAQSALLDWFGPGLVAGVFQRTSIYWLLALAALLWAFYNAWLAGETGQSYGRRWAGTRLIRDSDGALVTGPMGVVRHIAHVVDAVICFVGFLFPLWDVKKQTIADKIMGTVVVKV